MQIYQQIESSRDRLLQTIGHVSSVSCLEESMQEETNWMTSTSIEHVRRSSLDHRRKFVLKLNFTGLVKQKGEREKKVS